VGRKGAHCCIDALLVAHVAHAQGTRNDIGFAYGRLVNFLRHLGIAGSGLDFSHDPILDRVDDGLGVDPAGLVIDPLGEGRHGRYRNPGGFERPGTLQGAITAATSGRRSNWPDIPQAGRSRRED
jgi:hypothetical protein